MLARPLPIVVLMMVFGPAPPAPARAEGPPAPTRDPLHRVVDLDLGESRRVDWRDGTSTVVKLLALEESRDSIREAVRRAVVKVEVERPGRSS